MKKDYKEVFDEILEKKFSKNMQAGYDPLEVDMYLDRIRSFLVKAENSYEQVQLIIEEKNKEIAFLKKKILEKNDLILVLNSEIDSYKKDGYQSQKMVKDLSSLKAQVSELQNKQTNGNKK